MKNIFSYKKSTISKMEYCISAVRETTVNNDDGTTSEVRVPVTIGLRATINPVTTSSYPVSESYAGQVYSYPGNRIFANSFNEEEGNIIKTNGLDIIKTVEIDKLFTIMCESGNSFFDNYFVLNVVECPETKDLCQQLSKGSDANAKQFKLESLKTIFYPYAFRCSIVSNILKFIDCCTVRRVTTEKDLSDRCVICICNYDLGQDTRTLPCLHKFHRKCIDEWIVHDRCCPFCRVKIQFCSHELCKTITIDGNFSNDFEVPPAVSQPEPVQNIPSGTEAEDDIDRVFNLTFGDLDRLGNEEIDFVTFRETVQAILNLASERHHVDVVAMFEELQPGTSSQRQPTTKTSQSVSNLERRRTEPTVSTTENNTNSSPDEKKIVINKRPISTQIDKFSTPGSSIKRQKNSPPTTACNSTPTSQFSQKLRNPYYKNVAGTSHMSQGDQSSFTSSENLSKSDNNPLASILIENQPKSIQNKPTNENLNISIEFDGSSNSDTIEIDVTGLPQQSVFISEASSCDDVYVDNNIHTIIVENCICCNPDGTEVKI